MFYLATFRKKLILDSLKLLLVKYRSTRELYNAISQFFPSEEEEKAKFSYSQFNRYIKGKISIPKNKEAILSRFLHNNFNLATDLVQPNITIGIDSTPIQVDMSELLCYPDKVNLLAFHIIEQDHLEGKFDAILTHSGAIPLAVAFSQILVIPWLSVNFRPPPVHPSRISQHPYLIDQELVGTAYFIKNQSLCNKRLLVISDYIRRGGFLDILRRVVEDNEAEVHFLFSVVAIGSDYRRFYNELEGNIRIIHFV